MFVVIISSFSFMLLCCCKRILFGIICEDFDDEFGIDDFLWEWIYEG